MQVKTFIKEKYVSVFIIVIFFIVIKKQRKKEGTEYSPSDFEVKSMY